MATSGIGIWASFGKDSSVRDYAHAAQIFRTNDFARTPKSKYLFYVTINLNPNALSDQFTAAPEPTGPNELSYLVKNVELPKFEIAVQDLNQYNKKVLIQKEIKYTPVTIKFHDDNIGSLRNFWTSYYNYYYADGSYTDLDYDSSSDDKYTHRIKSTWGLDTGATDSYLTSIVIYSMSHGEASKITLQNPMISNFSHDSHDYSEGQGLMESTMQIRYTGVTYEDGVDAMYDIPGFGQDSPETYDTEYSSLSGGNAGLKINISTGKLFNPLTATAPTKKTYNPNKSLAAQTISYNKNTVSATSAVTNLQIASVLKSTANIPTSTGYVFPTATVQGKQHTDFGAVVNQTPGLVSSGSTIIPTPDQLNNLYPANSWQASLLAKGYTKNQILAADQFIFSQGTGSFGAGIPGQDPPNYQQIAEQFLNGANSDNFGYAYGQGNKTAKISGTEQAIYNGNDWKTQLSTQGFSSADIIAANQYISSLKIAPGTDLSTVAKNYISNSKSNGGSDVVYAGGTANFNEFTGTYTPV